MDKNCHGIPVLDHGYVLLRDYMGSDQTPVNAARASFHKFSPKFTEKDEKLLSYLVENKHLSVFRHCVVTIEWYAPIMVARQVWRYVIGNAQQETLDAWNEASYRYISNDFDWYVPQADEWRAAPANKKQGSDGNVDALTGQIARQRLKILLDRCLQDYEWAIDHGIAPEQARLFLPANGQYTYWWMTASLQGIIHLLEERGDPHAMWETRWYASAVYRLVYPLFQRSVDKLLDPALSDRLAIGSL